MIPERVKQMSIQGKDLKVRCSEEYEFVRAYRSYYNSVLLKVMLI